MSRKNRYLNKTLVVFLVVFSSVVSSKANELSLKFLIKQQAYGGGGIYLPVSFADHKFSMLLDTGASATYVIPAEWNENLPILGTKLANGINGISSVCLKLDLSDLKIISNNNAAEKGKFLQGLKCQDNSGDNILGINYLYGSNVIIDFKRRNITISDSLSGNNNSGSEFIKLNNGEGVLGVPIRLGSSSAIGLFDTGAAISAIDLKYVQQHKNEFELIKQNSLYIEASGNALRAELYKIKSISVGNSTILHNIYAISYDFSSLQRTFGENLIAIVGYNIISQYHWKIDLRSKRNPSWQAN